MVMLVPPECGSATFSCAQTCFQVFWALRGPGVELRRTSYAVEAACARIRASALPAAAEYAAELARPPSAAEANEFHERMATRSPPPA